VEGPADRHDRKASPSYFALASGGLTALLLFTTGCKKHDFPDYPANYREYAYVTNGGDGTVTVLDLLHMRQDRILKVGANPTGLAINPLRNEIYAVNSGSNSVSVIDAEHQAVVATIPVRRGPYFISVATTGDRAFVANSGSNTVSVLDLNNRRQIAVIGVGEKPGMARISPDGNALVVSNEGSGSVSVADPHTLRVRSVFPGCPGATDIVITPDSSRAFIACSAGHQVMAIGLAQTGSVSADNTGQARTDRLLTLLDVGKSPVNLALKPDGGEAFSSNFDSDSISEIGTSADEVGGTYAVGAGTVRGVVSQDNSLLWNANFRAGTVSRYSIDDGKMIGSIHIGGSPDALALSTEGHLLLVVDAASSEVAVIRAMTHSLFTMLPCGPKPNDIVVKSFKVK
jgi:YVTN family beta-propeller protein